MKLVVLTSYRFGIASACLPVLVQSGECVVTRVIVSRGRAASRLRRLQQKAKKTIRIGLLGALNGIRMRRWYEGTATADVVELCERLGIPVFETDQINCDETVRLMREAGAELGLSLGNSYIAERVFSVPKFGMINVHGERLPEYQNAQSVIWPIYNLESTTGLTIHQIDRSIDTGKILYREEYPIVFHPRLNDSVRATLKITEGRTPAAVRYVCENYERLLAGATPQQKGDTFTTPNIRQYIRMARNNRRLYRKIEHLAVVRTK
ncbi:MAG: formyltransferase family protein [Rhizomicrobium sp.]